MLIRDTSGNIVNIKRSDFVTDGDYYKQLSRFYDVNLNQSQNNTGDSVKEKTSIERISDYIKTM